MIYIMKNNDNTGCNHYVQWEYIISKLFSALFALWTQINNYKAAKQDVNILLLFVRN
jgi:hypothetical protein